MTEKRVLNVECFVVTLLVGGGFILAPAMAGFGLSWDGLNHQIYLGWQAESSRVGQDLLAASLQSYQFPLTYWPAYRLAMSGVDGVTAGMLLAAPGFLLVPPVWMISARYFPGNGVEASLQRFCCCAMAIMSAVVLKSFETTGNDILSSIPLLWAYALAMRHSPSTRFITGSGALAGLATAFKFSQGVLVIPLIWIWLNGRASFRVRNMLAGGGAAAVVFCATYAAWGLSLCVEMGNPIFPFGGDWFQSMGLCGAPQ